MHWRGHTEYMESLHSVYIVFPHILPKPYCSKSCDTLNKNKFEHQQGQASRTETHSMEIRVLFTINHMAEIFKSSSFPIGSWCYWKESPFGMWYSPQESWTVVLHNYASWALTICHAQNTCSLEIKALSCKRLRESSAIFMQVLTSKGNCKINYVSWNLWDQVFT